MSGHPVPKQSEVIAAFAELSAAYNKLEDMFEALGMSRYEFSKARIGDFAYLGENREFIEAIFPPAQQELPIA